MKLILAILAVASFGQAETLAGGALYPKPVDMKLLVLSGDGSESSFAAIQLYLNYMGIPERLRREVSPVQATLDPTNRITLRSETAITVPVTGICPLECDIYGGQKIARVQLEAGRSIDVAVN